MTNLVRLVLLALAVICGLSDAMDKVVKIEKEYEYSENEIISPKKPAKPGKQEDPLENEVFDKPHPPKGTEAPAGKETAPYEEDPHYQARQHMEDFLNLTERIFVRHRNFNFKSQEKCESAQRLQQINEREYKYRIRTRKYPYMTELAFMDVTFTVTKTGIHKDYNAVTYNHGPGEPKVERKLMYISPDKSCAILVEELRTGGKGCQLVQPESHIDEKVPDECNRVYKANCGKLSVQVYEPVCKKLRDYTHREEL